MITVIIAGGSGTRLWPLSTPNYPKHLLSLTGSKALVNYAYDRAKTVSDHIYVVTDSSHAHHVKDQLAELGDKNFIIEPGRRGTASCIVAALHHIGERHDHDEPIAFVAADHYVRDTAGFSHSFNIAGEVSKSSKRIVLVGVEPDHPATGFGYIQKNGLFDKKRFIFNVHSFTEKPDYKTAQKYFTSGKFLWNCGYFVGSLNTFTKAMKQFAPELLEQANALKEAKTAQQYQKTYLGFRDISIDYALIEKVQDLLVVPSTFDWLDLGSYGDLHKVVESDEKGNHSDGECIELEGVENSFIRNDQSKPLAVIGLDNVVVVNTEDGVLVTRKDLAQKVGDVAKRIHKKETR